MSCDKDNEENRTHDLEDLKDDVKHPGGNPLDNVAFTQEVSNKESEDEKNVEEEKQICDVL